MGSQLDTTEQLNWTELNSQIWDVLFLVSWVMSAGSDFTSTCEHLTGITRSEAECQSRSQTKWPPATLQASVSVIQCHRSYCGIPFIPQSSCLQFPKFPNCFCPWQKFYRTLWARSEQEPGGPVALLQPLVVLSGAESRERISICINVLDWLMWQKWADSIHTPGRGWSAKDFRSGPSGRTTRQRWERPRPVCGSEVRTPAPDLQPLCKCGLAVNVNLLGQDTKYSNITATATAKSLQSCPTLCDPRDRSPPGSPVPGILQARPLEWVAISFSNAWKWKVKVKSLSRVRLLATPWTAAYQAPPSMGFSRQEYWSGVPSPSPTVALGEDRSGRESFIAKPFMPKLWILGAH